MVSSLGVLGLALASCRIPLSVEGTLKWFG